MFEFLAQAEGHGGVLGPLAFHLVVFLLAIFLGLEVIAKVPAQLHTPLMSGSNAISGIALIGALVVAGPAGPEGTSVSVLLGLGAVVMATVNVVGGFLVTDRMLQMFRKKPDELPAARDRVPL